MDKSIPRFQLKERNIKNCKLLLNRDELISHIPKNSIILEFYGARHDHIKNLSLKPEYQNLIQLKGHINRSKILEKQ